MYPFVLHAVSAECGIEHDFSALKIAIMYSPINTSIDKIIRNYYAK